MQKVIERMFRIYGQTALVTLQNSGAVTEKIFLQPINSRSWQDMERVYTPLGSVPKGRSVCILQADTSATTGDTLTVDGRAYRIVKLEPMAMAGKILYYWGLCLQKGGEQGWDSER